MISPCVGIQQKFKRLKRKKTKGTEVETIIITWPQKRNTRTTAARSVAFEK